MAVCKHGTFFFPGVCGRCGQEADDSAAVAFDYVCEGLKLAPWEINRLRRSNTRALLQQRRLILVLDLDHTLLHSVEELAEEEMCLVSVAHELRDDPDRSLFLLDGGDFITKLRPFVRTFLEEASTMFQMYIYTMGSRDYALEMAKLLDPDGNLFKNRVISCEDCTMPHQKGLDVVLGEESIVLILDDTEDVWKRHRQNLIHMEKYNFFAPRCRGRNPGINDEREAYVALQTTLDVLKRLHQMFFDPGLGADIASRDIRELLKVISHVASSSHCSDSFGCNMPQQGYPLLVGPAACSM